MLILKMEKMDELSFLVSELENIVYLQSLVNSDKNLQQFDDSINKCFAAQEYLHDLNIDVVKRLYKLVASEDFVISTKVRKIRKKHIL